MLLLRLLVLAALAPAAGAAPSSPPPALRVTAIPEARESFQKSEAAFTAWLARQTGVPVVLRLATTYDEAVALLASRKADMVDQMVADKAVDPAKVRVVWTNPPFMDQSWVAARAGCDRGKGGALA